MLCVTLAAGAVAVGLISAGADGESGQCQGCWKPRTSNFPWQIQLQGKLDLKVRARVYEIDGFDRGKGAVRALHRRGRRVICYLNAGAWESFRPDAASFPEEVLGKRYVGYPDERWLDIRRIDLLEPLLGARLDACASKGFDAADPDNVNGYQNDTGFPLTAADQLRFNRWLADEIHERGMAAILKNDGPQVPDLVDPFDGAVVEECFQFRECGLYAPFVRAGKPVFAIEYRSPSARVCRAAKRRRFSMIFKRTSLRAYRRTCRDIAGG
jgi:hypothetical protein